MKHYYLFLLTVLAGALHAQNWLPLAPGDRFSYRHSDSVLISNVLQVDSQKILPGGDLAFFLNRVVLDCDTCIVQRAKLANQGQFLQKNMLRTSGGRWVFQGKQSFALFPLAQLGESWLLDTAQNLTATVLGVSAQTVLGMPDSVKTISLSNGAQIILSKGHGILQFPDGSSGATFELVGIPSRNLGEKLPGWLEFYDFQPGDVLEYESNYSWAPGTPANLFTRDKRRILDRFWDADTLVYAVDQLFYKTLYWSGPPSHFYVHNTYLWKVHPALAEPWTVGYPGQFFTAPEAPNGEQGSRVTWEIDTVYGVSQVLGEGSADFAFQWGGCALFQAPAGSEEEVLPCDPCGSAFHRRHSVGLGLVSHTISCFEFWDYGKLTGWIKNGDTTGIITPDSFFLVSTRPEPLAFPVQVAPNPSNGDWRLLFPETATESLHYVLRDIHGRLVLESDIPQGAEQQRIPGAAWSSGVYVLKIQGKSGVKEMKLIRN